MQILQGLAHPNWRMTMKSFVKMLGSLAIAALAILGTNVNAMPFTFRFVMPSWNDPANTGINTTPALFGDHIELLVTVDNSMNVKTSQSYLNSEIQSIRAIAAGGSFDYTWDSSASWAGNSQGLSYISTDSAGIATLDLLPRPLTSSLYVSAPFADIILAQITPSGGVHSLFLSLPGLVHYAYYSPMERGEFRGFTVASSADTLVIPEPGTSYLLGVGMILLAFTACRPRLPSSRSALFAAG
jgi:hypothetical protein